MKLYKYTLFIIVMLYIGSGSRILAQDSDCSNMNEIKLRSDEEATARHWKAGLWFLGLALPGAGLTALGASSNMKCDDGPDSSRVCTNFGALWMVPGIAMIAGGTTLGIVYLAKSSAPERRYKKCLSEQAAKQTKLNWDIYVSPASAGLRVNF